MSPVVDKLTKVVAPTIDRGNVVGTVKHFSSEIVDSVKGNKTKEERKFLANVSLEVGLCCQMFEQHNLGKVRVLFIFFPGNFVFAFLPSNIGMMKISHLYLSGFHVLRLVV